MLKKLAVIFFVLHYIPAFAQAPFAQVSQTPLLVNPSLAGSKAKQRISAAVNTYGSAKEKYANGFVSYDGTLKKLGSGFGVYYSYNAFSQDTAQSAERQLYKSSSKFGSSSQRHTVGVAIAPKYSVYSKAEPNKIIYSFSPSLGLEYGHLSLAKDYNYQTYTGTVYDTSYVGGHNYLDYASYYLSTLSANTFRISMGFQLNSDNTLVQYRASYGVELVHEKEGITSTNSSLQSPTTKSYNYSLYYIDQSLNAGRTFAIGQGNFAITCLGGIGYKHYLSPLASNQIYDVNFIGGKATTINYKHLSVTGKIYRLLLGLAYTQSFLNTYSGITIGYQSDNIKITSTWNVLTKGSLFSEITASYLF